MTRPEGYGAGLFDQHAAMLAASCVPPDLAHARGYVSVDTRTRLESVHVTKDGRRVPGLLIPLRRKDGSAWGHQYRPDSPRLRGGKPVKYETPTGQRNGIDVPPGVGPLLDDPAVPLWVTEGTKKADAAAALGLACIALPGVWSWRGTNAHGGKTAIPDWHDVALNGRRVVLAFDSDVVVKPSVRVALDQLAGYLTTKGARVEFCHLPEHGDGKTGLDDHIAAGATTADLYALVHPQPPDPVQDTIPEAPPPQEPAPAAPRAVPVNLATAHATFTRWLGADYDLRALDAVLAAAAAERLDGDPVWLLMISGSGNAKTETVVALVGAGAHITSTVSSEGALLSATSTRERSQDSTGGLLRKIGSRGLLVVKDFTSILSMNRDARAAVLAALREVADGYWERNVGTDGGKTLTWSGRIVLIGAVTTAFDAAHQVISVMGDRFVLVRVDSTLGRRVSGRRAISNVGSETTMRAELAGAVAGVLAGIDPSRAVLDDDDIDVLLDAADLVTYVRTATERDFQGNVIDAHAPEMPTRFAKMLGQIVRGARALGMDRHDSLALAYRCAGDSAPPLRLAVLADVANHPGSVLPDVVKRLQKPRTTVDRCLQEMHVLGLLLVDEVQEVDRRNVERVRWSYRLADVVDADVVRDLAARTLTRNVTTRGLRDEVVRDAEDVDTHADADDTPPTDIPGERSDDVDWTLLRQPFAEQTWPGEATA